ncbi:unnamed protein product [Sphagnum troendelagicum]|uniref:MADS-box transcription factor n=1 Tax=Sphagnum troendelagicum TaxID=128251 RepID=A0ABP0UNJ0_9BRYO
MASAFARVSQRFRKISEELHLERRNTNSTQGINMNPSMATPLSSALHLCKKIREDYSHISVGHLGRFAINRQQSMLLFNKVVETENTLEAIQVKLSQLDTTSSGFPNGGPHLPEVDIPRQLDSPELASSPEGSSPEGGNLSASRVSTSIQAEGYHLFDQEDIDFLERLSQIDPDHMTQADIDSLARLLQND